MELLEQHFDTAFSAHNGIQKLRELILTLAMQGKLVSQDPSDAPASQLLKDIEAEKKRLAKEGKIKAPKPLPEITTEEIPGDLPDGWAWVRNGFLFGLRKGKVPKDLTETVGSIPYLDIEALDRGNIRRYTEDAKAPQSTNSDILVVCDGSRSGLVLDGQNGAIGSTLSVIETPLFIQPFVKLIFRQGYERMNSSMKGAAIPHLDSKNLLLEVIGLPPLAEQKRILEKIDQLMVRCDALGSLRNEREKKRLASHAAALSQLLDTTGNGSADDAWAFITQHFGDLYAVRENVTELRKAILQLAVLGRLVPQDLNEGVTRKVTMEELVGRKNLKNGLSLSPVDRPSDFECLPLSAMKGSTIDCSVGKPIEIDHSRAEPYLIKPRDIFIIRGNGNKDRVGLAGMARTCPPNVLFPDLFIRVPLPPNKIDGDYFLIAWNSPVTREILERLAATTSGIWKINQGHISECEIPLPPLAEQTRIVAKVDELMALCDKLNKQIDAATDKQVELLNSVMAQV